MILHGGHFINMSRKHAILFNITLEGKLIGNMNNKKMRGSFILFSFFQMSDIIITFTCRFVNFKEMLVNDILVIL